jgi:hypothetical protein
MDLDSTIYIDMSGKIIVSPTSRWLRTLFISRVTRFTLSVPGAGFWGRSRGSTTFTYRRLETSTSYNQLKKEIQFSSGIMGFWDWLSIAQNVERNSEAVNEIFNELNREQNISMQLRWDMEVTGLYPNVPVSATTFIRLMRLVSSEGIYFVASDGAVIDDTGANDQNNIELPIRNNESTITVL